MIPSGLLYISGFFSVLASIKFIFFPFLILFCMNNGKARISKFMFSVILFMLTLLIITIYKNGDVTAAIKQFIDYLYPIFWMEHILDNYERPMLRLILQYFGLLCVANVLIAVILPEGIARSGTNIIYLLGLDNKISFTYIPIFALSLMYIEKFCNKDRKLLFYIISIIVFTASNVLVWAVGGLMGFSLMLMLWFANFYMSKLHTLRKLINFRSCIIAVAIVCYLVVFSKIFQKGILADFIVNVLHKTVSFSSRTVLWEQAITKVKKSLYIGYGLTKTTLFDFAFFNRNGILKGFSSHNGYLRLLLEGGIVLLVMYFNMLFSVTRGKIKECSEHKEVQALIFGTAGFLLACIFEAEYCSAYFLMLLTAIHYYLNKKI